MGEDNLQAAISAMSKFNFNIAKNVIIFIGDGMSIPTITAARIYKAQSEDRNFETPESSSLTFETLPHLGLSKTYNIDKQTADSASTASAIFSGVKTKYYTAGFDSSVVEDDLESARTAEKVTTIAEWAQEAGKHTGLVTTTRVTHATPMALYAHTASRDWECDTEMPANAPEDVKDIARQLIENEPGRNLRVVLGGGSSAFLPQTHPQVTTPEYEDPPTKAEFYDPKDESWDCFRLDQRNLLDEWQTDKSSRGYNGTIVRSATELRSVDVNRTDFLFGLFAEGHTQWDDKRSDEEPSLTEMTRKAIQMLSKSPSGFFLMVESGRIDHAHHDVQANRALSETVALDRAVEVALQMTSEEDTLIIVTADHSHTMSLQGYPDRGNDITGLTGVELDDGLPYTTLSYANGMAYYVHNILDGEGGVTRLNLTNENPNSFDFHQTSAGYRDSETHGGDDVPIFARGPMSHLFHKTHEQTHIANVMAYSACIGRYVDFDERCLLIKSVPKSSSAAARPAKPNISAEVVFITLTVLLLCGNLVPVGQALGMLCFKS